MSESQECVLKSYKKNESLLFEEKVQPQHVPNNHPPPSIESEEDSGVELSNANDSDHGTGNTSTNTSEDGFNDSKSDITCTTNQNGDTKQKSDKDGNSNLEVNVIVDKHDGKAIAKHDANKQQSATPQDTDNLPQTKDGDNPDTNKSANKDSNKSKKRVVLKDIAEEVESDSSYTDNEVLGDRRIDFDNDTVHTTDSNVSDSGFKRSRSFGDRPARRRTNFKQTRSVSVDTTNCKDGGVTNPAFDLTYEDADDDGKWRLSLEQFTSKRYGSKRKTSALSREMRSYYKNQDELIDTYKQNRRYSTGSFYKSQDDLINQYEEIRLDIADAMENAETLKQLRKKAALYAKITFFVNLLLLAIKIVAVVMSGSISLVSSLVDSAVDLVSGVVIWVTTRAVKKTDRYVYPQGRTKLEPMSIVILSVIMSVASVQIIKESFSKIVGLANQSSDPPEMDIATTCIASVTVVAKFILYLLCRRINHPTVLALAMDHRNDVLSNFIAIVFGYIGSVQMQNQVDAPGLVYLDPVGAIAISIYIIVNWCITGWDQIKVLIGHTATSDFISKITWICVDHHKKIQMVDTVKAYHFGNNFLVEVDIVLPADMTLREAHDIAEPLQQKIEGLPNVERAFVHVDYECSHDPKSEHKIV